MGEYKAVDGWWADRYAFWPMSSHDAVFWVGVTLLGAGLFVILENKIYGWILIAIGAAGILWGFPALTLSRPHLPFGLLACACVLLLLASPPLWVYWRFRDYRIRARKLNRKMEAFELEAMQHAPVDTDPALHAKRRREYELWEESEFKKQLAEDIRAFYPRMFSHPDSSIETEREADDEIRKLAKSRVRRDIFSAYLQVDSHLPFSLKLWFKKSFGFLPKKNSN